MLLCLEHLHYLCLLHLRIPLHVSCLWLFWVHPLSCQNNGVVFDLILVLHVWHVMLWLLWFGLCDLVLLFESGWLSAGDA